MNETCETVQAMLPDYRWLSPRERAPLDRHLASCERCRSEWRDAQAVDDLFMEARRPAPPGFADAVMTALEPSPPPVAVNRLWPLLAGALAVEVAVAVVLRVNPAPWWRALTAWGGEMWRNWCAPLASDAMGLVSVAKELAPSLDATFWGGALAVVAGVAWFTLNLGRTKHV